MDQRCHPNGRQLLATFFRGNQTLGAAEHASPSAAQGNELCHLRVLFRGKISLLPLIGDRIKPVVIKNGLLVLNRFKKQKAFRRFYRFYFG